MAESVQYSHSVLEASDEMKDIYCEPCGKYGNVAIAEGYCVNCPEYLCGKCYKAHRRNKVLAKHVLLDKDKMPIAPDYNRKVLDICEEKCAIHSDKVIEFFCETCDKLGCNVCVTLDHRPCDKMKHIPDIAKSLANNEWFIAFHEDIKLFTDKLSKFEQKIQMNVTSNYEMRKRAKQELKRQRAKVIGFFDRLEKKMDDQILTIKKRNKVILKTVSDRLKPIKKELDRIKNDIDAKRTGQNCELFIAMKCGKEKMRTFGDHLNKMQGELTIQHYTLLPSEQIQSMMKTITEICRISTARLVSVIDIKTNKEKTKPNIYCMHGHYCVITGWANRSIKVIDTKSNCFTSEIGIEAKYIWSVTTVRDDQIAVSVTLSDTRNQIQYFSLSASGVIQRTNQLYDVENIYRDMVHCEGYMYGLNSTHKRIDILRMTGKIIRKIQTDDKGADMFGDLQRICLSPDGQTLYVTDSEKHSVTSMTLDGKIKVVYTDKDLQYPCGITVDKQGYAYVLSRDTRNIQQLTADLNKVQVLIEDVNGINMTYSSAENKLYIDDNNNINQYSLDFK